MLFIGDIIALSGIFFGRFGNLEDSKVQIVFVVSFLYLVGRVGLIFMKVGREFIAMRKEWLDLKKKEREFKK